MPRPTAEIRNPAPFVTQQVVSFQNGAGHAQAVAAEAPLPVEIRAAAPPDPVTAVLATGSHVVGPFVAVPGPAIWVALTGSFAATVRVARSTDSGATRLSLTMGGQPWAMFTAPCNEPVAEETTGGVQYFLECTVTAGTLTCEVRQ
jgi:hypothetical protein